MRLPSADRTFVAADGRRWQVREHEVRTAADRAVRRLLLFESRHILRWLRDFPRDWRALSDGELERLSWRQ